MNQEPSYAKLLDTVREAGGDVETMTAFAKLVAAAEREECAKVCEDAAGTGKIISCMSAAVAIRARGETK
jgi:hypothetical protein